MLPVCVLAVPAFNIVLADGVAVAVALVSNRTSVEPKYPTAPRLAVVPPSEPPPNDCFRTSGGGGLLNKMSDTDTLKVPVVVGVAFKLKLIVPFGLPLVEVEPVTVTVPRPTARVVTTPRVGSLSHAASLSWQKVPPVMVVPLLVPPMFTHNVPSVACAGVARSPARTQIAGTASPLNCLFIDLLPPVVPRCSARNPIALRVPV